MDKRNALCANESRKIGFESGGGLGGLESGVGGNAVLGAGLWGGGTDSLLEERLLALWCELTVLVLCQEAPEARLENDWIPDTMLCGLLCE